MRFNAKKNQEHPFHQSSYEPPEGIRSGLLPHQASKRFPGYTNNEDKQLTPIDILTVDTHSRVTLTKKFKKILPINPLNKIVVYQDLFSKTIVCEIQTDENGEQKTIATYVVTKSKGKSSSPQSFTSSEFREDNVKANDQLFSRGSDSQGNYLQYKDTLSTIPILLVEDDKDVLKSYLLLLKSEGYSNIKTFYDSREALVHVVDPKFSQFYRLVITDIRMPGINGMNLYRILKILNPSIMAIFATGLDAAEEVMSVYPEINSQDIIGKPASRQSFLKAINNKIGNFKPDW